MTNRIQNIRNEVRSGKCEGTINGVDRFNASLVELSEQSLPHGQAYVMFARHRNSDWTAKELKLAFMKGLPDNTYPVTPGSNQVILTFADFSNPAKTIVYTQQSGDVVIKYDSNAGVLSGKLEDVTLINQDDDVLKEVKLKIDFDAKGDIASLRRDKTRAA